MDAEQAYRVWILMLQVQGNQEGHCSSQCYHAHQESSSRAGSSTHQTNGSTGRTAGTAEQAQQGSTARAAQQEQHSRSCTAGAAYERQQMSTIALLSSTTPHCPTQPYGCGRLLSTAQGARTSSPCAYSCAARSCCWVLSACARAAASSCCSAAIVPRARSSSC